jgi:Transglutaminase-like superfamily
MSDEQAFAALSRRACPPVGEALFAVTAAWRSVNWGELDRRLDDLALPLFGAGESSRERAGALGELLVGDFRPETKAVDALWLDAVLDTRRGHPVLLVAIATELGRRSGWEVTVCSSPTGWYAGLHHDGVLWLVDPTGLASGDAAPEAVRRHCAHEIAFVVLTGLAARFTGSEDEAQARRLRDRLDVFAP